MLQKYKKDAFTYNKFFWLYFFTMGWCLIPSICRVTKQNNIDSVRSVKTKNALIPPNNITPIY
jgi:hypothetical protein